MNTGKQGEEVVAQWLTNRGVEILYHRWRWKRGEIDLIAIAGADSKLGESDTLLFIEVKTRNRANWDADGLLAITLQKQATIVRTAELFLLKHPHLAEYPCRFDVAIVRHQPIAVRVASRREDPWRSSRISLLVSSCYYSTILRMLSMEPKFKFYPTRSPIVGKSPIKMLYQHWLLNSV
jgi:putative endonuclease